MEELTWKLAPKRLPSWYISIYFDGVNSKEL